MQRFTFFVMLTAFTAFGQEASRQPVPGPAFHRFEIGVQFAPELGYRVLKEFHGGDMPINVRDKSESAIPTFTTGLSAVYRFNELLGIEAGLQFSRKGYFVESFRMQGTDYDLSIRNVFDYFTIPVSINCTMGHKAVRFAGSVGLSIDYLFVGREWLDRRYDNGHRDYYQQRLYDISDQEDFNTWNLSVIASAGVDWKLSPRMHLRTAPVLRYGLLKINTSGTNTYLWNAGLDIGFYYGL